MTNNFSTNLRIARKNKNLSQAELANKVHSTNTNISNYETGYSEPPLEILLKISKELDVSIDFLCGNTLVGDIYKDIYRKELELQLLELEEFYNNKKDELQIKLSKVK